MKLWGNMFELCQRPHAGLAVLMLAHLLLVGGLTFRYAPTQDEIAHLPAGILVWKRGDFSVYRVNPHLVRSVAALPVLAVPHEENWSWYVPGSSRRIEWTLGNDFLVANGPQVTGLFTCARLACLPFSLLGLWCCYRWGSELTSPRGGLLAAALWAFSPNLLGHAALITPDVAATSFGLLACWRFAKWQKQPTLANTCWVGLTTGAALLTKSYWITLLGIWPLLATLGFWRERRRLTLASSADSRWLGSSPFSTAGMVLLMLLLALNVLNLGYLFTGTGTLLKDYEFYSAALSGKTRIPGEDLPGNRFQDSLLETLPVPFPRDYLTGIDLQKLDFELGKWSYLNGEVKESGGWIYYYLWGLIVKVPLGIWLLVFLGISVWIRLPAESRSRLFFELLPLLIPALALFLLVSSQTGINRHLRYVFPVLPGFYLIAAFSVSRWPRVALLAVCGVIASSLSVYPHCLSYFNEACGGPRAGHRYFIDSNLDWGQDLLLVRDWLDRHPEARPAWLASRLDISPEHFNIPAIPVPPGELHPGWYLISRHERQHPSGRYQVFDTRSPIDQIGYTFDIYHITSQ